MLSHFSHVQLFVTPWTVACQTPLSMGFSRQEYWSGLPFPAPGDLNDPGIKPASLKSPTFSGEFFATDVTWEAQKYIMLSNYFDLESMEELCLHDAKYVINVITTNAYSVTKAVTSNMDTMVSLSTVRSLASSYCQMNV